MSSFKTSPYALQSDDDDGEALAGDDWQQRTHNALIEILHGIFALRLKLEADTGQSLASLGLFQDDNHQIN